MPTYNIVVFGGDYAGPEVCYHIASIPVKRGFESSKPV